LVGDVAKADQWLADESLVRFGRIALVVSMTLFTGRVVRPEGDLRQFGRGTAAGNSHSPKGSEQGLPTTTSALHGVNPADLEQEVDPLNARTQGLPCHSGRDRVELNFGIANNFWRWWGGLDRVLC